MSGFAERFIQQGKQEGREEGRQEGELTAGSLAQVIGD